MSPEEFCLRGRRITHADENIPPPVPPALRPPSGTLGNSMGCSVIGSTKPMTVAQSNRMPRHPTASLRSRTGRRRSNSRVSALD